MKPTLWILGAADPEMIAIEELARASDGHVAYVCTKAGGRVRHETSYESWALAVDVHDYRAVVVVECGPSDELEATQSWGPLGLRPEHARLRVPGITVVRIDHHRPGDPGYGRPPAEFLAASSLGQAVAQLARRRQVPATWHRREDHPGLCVEGDIRYQDGEYCVCVDVGDGRACDYVHERPSMWAHIPQALVLVAAADHCLSAAYHYQCPGVYPSELGAWRAQSRAEFRGCSVDQVRADVEAAIGVLRTAPSLELRPEVRDGENSQRAMYARDLRGLNTKLPELPEAAAREGLCFVADGLPGPSGRVKFVCQSGSPEQIEAFLHVWAPAHGLTDLYGDPARGFAGGYKEAQP